MWRRGSGASNLGKARALPRPARRAGKPAGRVSRPVPEDHEGRLVLWVGDKDMAETDKPAWPLLKAGTVDLFKPFKVDQLLMEVRKALQTAIAR